MNIEAIAHVCHEANRALQVEQADPTIGISVLWHELDEETRQSAIQGVKAIVENSHFTPQESHEMWVNFKLQHGWSLGSVKDEVLKEHPLLVPYDSLPESQKTKDALFFAIVNALKGEA